MVDELTKALLLEEVATRRAIAEALFASVNGAVPVLEALVDARAVSDDALSRYLARSDVPFVRHVVAVPELTSRLPRGLAARLLAVPIRLDAITGTVDVAVADPTDPHPAREIGYHLGAPVRVVRAPLAAIEEAIRRSQMQARARDPRAEHTPHLGAQRIGPTLPPPAPALSSAMPSPSELTPRRLVVEPDSVAPDGPHAPHGRRIQTPPWGTPVHRAPARPHLAPVRPSSAPPPNGYGSEIPIPLTRRTFGPAAIVGAIAADRRAEVTAAIPKAPPLPDVEAFAAYAPDLPFPDLSGAIGALRAATSRDAILELVLAGARAVARKVGVFVVKKGGYLGWACTPEFGSRAALESTLIPLDADSVFDRAVHEELYLGPIRYDEVHAPLLRVLQSPSRDVAAVPIRVSGKTAAIIVADELGDTMLGTRRLEELARAAGEAFARILRARR